LAQGVLAQESCLAVVKPLVPLLAPFSGDQRGDVIS